MNYEKPEVVELGEAPRLIEFTGKSTGDAGPGNQSDCELDD